MLTGEIRSNIDALWNAFWSGGIANPLEVIEQITYLLFLKRLDDLHTLEENKATRLKLKKLARRALTMISAGHGSSISRRRNCSAW
jgi:type I restriction enzyme M protein